MIDITGLGTESKVFMFIPDFDNYNITLVPMGAMVNLSKETTISIGYRYSTMNRRRIEATFTLTNRKDVNKLIDFFKDRKGNLKRFWMPLWQNEFDLYEDYQIEYTMKIQKGYLAQVDTTYLRTFIVIPKGDLSYPDIYVRKVRNIYYYDAYDILVLDNPINRSIKKGQYFMFGRMILVRFEESTINFTYSFIKEKQCLVKASASFIELPFEYKEIEGEDITYNILFYE